jgi:hypothetical protein
MTTADHDRVRGARARPRPLAFAYACHPNEGSEGGNPDRVALVTPGSTAETDERLAKPMTTMCHRMTRRRLISERSSDGCGAARCARRGAGHRRHRVDLVRGQVIRT